MPPRCSPPHPGRWLLGSVAALVTVQPGAETAVATALGAAADAVVVESVGAAVDAIRHLTATAGADRLVVGDAPVRSRASTCRPVPTDTHYALDAVTAPTRSRPTLTQLLAGWSWSTSWPWLGPWWASRPTDGGHPLRRRARPAVARRLHRAPRACSRSRRPSTRRPSRPRRGVPPLEQRPSLTAAEERRGRSGPGRAALTRLHESDARLAAVAEQLGQLGGRPGGSRRGRRLDVAFGTAEQARAATPRRLAELLTAGRSAGRARGRGARPRSVTRSPAEAQPPAMPRSRHGSRSARSRSGSRPGRSCRPARPGGRSSGARERARGPPRARGPRGGRRRRGRAGADGRPVRRWTRRWGWQPWSARGRRRPRGANEAKLGDCGSRLRELDGRARPAHRLRPPRRGRPGRAAAAHRAGSRPGRWSEFGIDARRRCSPSTARSSSVPPSGARPGSRGPTCRRRPSPTSAGQQEKRLRAAERELALLGKVNPLALEEFAALEERHRFLTEQLDDLKRTRRDLLDIVREVDDRVERGLHRGLRATSSASSSSVFARLFPGGEGRLVLTDPEDMLTTGIEVEARPPGQEGQAAVAAVRRRAVADRGGVPGGALQGPSQPVLRARRGRGRARRRQPRPLARRLRGAAREQPAHRDHAPEAHDGDRRRAVRRLDARRRRHRR